MFHGTHKSNAQAIITSGFKPSAGGTLGPGVYCSRDINKAMSYPPFCAANDRVVFKLQVRVGKVKKIDNQCMHLQTTWHQNGYNTAWLPASVFGFEEDCVWDPKRIMVVDIAHCGDSDVKNSLLNLIKQQDNGPGQEARGSAGKLCKACGMQTEDMHTVEKCWVCKAPICAFMRKHICSNKWLHTRFLLFESLMTVALAYWFTLTCGSISLIFCKQFIITCLDFSQSVYLLIYILEIYLLSVKLLWDDLYCKMC